MHISLKEIFLKSWQLTRQHFMFLAGLLLVIGLAEGLTNGKEIISSLLRFFLGPCILLVLTRTSLDIVDGKKPSIEAIRAEFKYFRNYFAYLIFAAALILGLILFIIPGVYVLLSWGFFAYLIADKRYGAFESLKQSALLTKGVRWQLAKFFFTVFAFYCLIAYVAFMGIGVLLVAPSTIAIGSILGLLAVLFILILPVSMFGSALIYRMLTARMAATTPPSVPPQEPAETSSSKEEAAEVK